MPTRLWSRFASSSSTGISIASFPSSSSVLRSLRTSPRLFHLLGATTFVTEVQEPTLALMVPLLDRGLAERETAIKRKAAVIVDNMCKLVDDPNIVAPFLPKMMPGLQKNYDNLADPEAREKTKQALDTLIRVGNIVDGKIPEVHNHGDISTVLGHLKEVLAGKHAAAVEKFGPVLEYISAVAGQLVDEKELEAPRWAQNVKPYLTVVVGDADSEAITDALRKKASPGIEDEEAVEPDEEEGEDLCNCTFLARLRRQDSAEPDQPPAQARPALRSLRSQRIRKVHSHACHQQRAG